MSDARLRELERRFEQTKALDDEVALLRERFRVGNITRQALDVAAELIQYPAACVSLGSDFTTRQAPTAQRWESDLHAIPFTDGDGGVHPLGVLAAAVLADEAALLLDIYEQTDPVIIRLIESARNILRRMNGSRKRVIHHLTVGDVARVDDVRVAWCGGGVDEFADGVILQAIITFTLLNIQYRRADLAVIIGCFLRSAPIRCSSRELRQRWFRTAMMKALIPHLLGHPSTVPHPPHLSDMTTQQRTPER